MTGKIAITPRSLSVGGHPALDALTAEGYELVFPSPGEMPSADTLRATLPGCVGWLAGVEPVPVDVLESAPSLRVISRNGTGVDNIPLPVAERLGIAVERAAGANARGVAELAFALMLCGLRHIPWSHERLRAGAWQRRIGTEAEGRTLGVIGCGAVGRLMARMASGFGMTVIGHDPYPVNDFAPDGFRYGTIAEILAEADAISLHCPPSPAPILDETAFEAVRRGVVIVNTARAELVDEAALLAALDSGRVGAYATDVYRQEPPEPSPLLMHERVILMPHAGGFTEESVDRATESAVENLLTALGRR